MQSDLPKVLHTLNAKPLITYVIESLTSAGVGKVVTVIGHKGELVQETLGSSSEFVWQHEQLGTGHAVMQAEEILKDFDGGVIVACGDVPLIKKETFSSLIKCFESDEVKAVVLAMDIENPTGYGRILRDNDNNFVAIREQKDATEEELLVKEVNTGTYIFDSKFLFEGLGSINTDNAQGEYYLPDVLEYIVKSNYKVEVVTLDNPIEGSGVNTKEDLIKLEDLV